MIGQVILVVYNIADAFFVGLAGSDSSLAAVSVCMPALMFLSAISNLFGVGAASVISRSLGNGDSVRVKAASAFAFFGCLALTFFYSLFAYVFKDSFVDILGGTNPLVHRKSVTYLICTITAGGIATAVSVLFSHLIRAEGRSVSASVGISIGGISNIILDPLLIFVCFPKGSEVLGAAAATAISNLISLFYFIIVLIRIRKRSFLSFRLSRSIFKKNVSRDIIVTGFPAFVMTLFENISYAVLDKLMSLQGLPMQVGVGVAKKINMLSHCIVRGIAQGSLPLIGYNYSSGNYKRMHDCVKISKRLSVTTAAVLMFINLVFARALVSVFIHANTPSLSYGAAFLRILCIGGPFSAGAYIYISFFQAIGSGGKSFILAIMRKGLFDIPLMFILGGFFAAYGIAAATPVTDIICFGVSNIMFGAYLRRLSGNT